MVAKVQLCLAFALIFVIGSVLGSEEVDPDPTESVGDNIMNNFNTSATSPILPNPKMVKNDSVSDDIDERGLLDTVTGIGISGNLPGPITGHTLLLKNGKLVDLDGVLNLLSLADVLGLKLQINNILGHGHGHTKGSQNSENDASSCIEELDNLLKDKQLASLDKIILNILNEENGELLLMKVIRISMNLGNSSQLDNYLLLSITKHCTRPYAGVSKNYIKFAQKILIVKTVFGSKAAKKQVEKYLRKNK